VIERAYIHVGGPAASGKTTFIEAVLAASDELILAARCLSKDSLTASRETSPQKHPELRRFRDAGASGVALFEFPTTSGDSDDFFMTRLMSDYSEAVVVEGDCPLTYVDVDVFIASPLSPSEPLFVRGKIDRAAADRATVERWRELLEAPDGVARWLQEELGVQAGGLFTEKPQLFEGSRKTMLDTLARAAKARPSKPIERWFVADRYAGIEHAGLVAVNVHGVGERAQAERLLSEVTRMRKDPELYKDVIGWRGSKTPITAVVANLLDGQDAGRKKAIARVRRAILAAVKRGRNH